MLSGSTSRRRSWRFPTLNVRHRRSVRIAFLSSLLAFGMLLVYLSPAEHPFELEPSYQGGDGSAPMSSSYMSARRLIRRASPLIMRNRDDDDAPLEAREGGDGGGNGNPFEAFRKGWPRLRDHRARGRDMMRRRQGGKSFDWYGITKLFVFGDSYSTLDKDYRKDGVDWGHPQHLHHKATDMKWTEYLYAVFKDFHALQYWNLAKVGAVISDEVIEPGLEEYGTFGKQVDEFQELFTPMPGPHIVDWHSNDTLFLAFFGINDMGRMNREDLPAGRLDIPSTSSALASATMQNVRRLRSLGARHILLINLPPLDRSPKYSLPHEPGIRSHELIGQSVRVFNTRLEELVRAYRLELELEKDNDEDETNVFLFDLWSYWNLVLDYPEVFGMTDCSRYKVLVNGDDVNLGRLGFCYHDNQHISWSSAALIARAVNGFLHRHSASFFESEATEHMLNVTTT